MLDFFQTNPKSLWRLEVQNCKLTLGEGIMFWIDEPGDPEVPSRFPCGESEQGVHQYPCHRPSENGFLMIKLRYGATKKYWYLKCFVSSGSCTMKEFTRNYFRFWAKIYPDHKHTKDQSCAKRFHSISPNFCLLHGRPKNYLVILVFLKTRRTTGFQKYPRKGLQKRL